MVLPHFYEKQRPKGYLTPRKGLLLDIPYPFLGHRRLDFSDCMKIIRIEERVVLYYNNGQNASLLY